MSNAHITDGQMVQQGDPVMISGLKARPEMNGKCGEILDGPRDSGRCVSSLACQHLLVGLHPEMITVLFGHASCLNHTCMPNTGTE